MEKVDFKIEDGIIYGPYPKGVHLDVHVAKQIVADRIDFLNGKKLPAIVDTTGIQSITKDAKEYMAKPEASKGIVAAALLSKSVFSKYLSNFFIKVSIISSPIPIRVFTDEESAKNWLEQFKQVQ